MPFTPSHAVVALPFIRTPLVPAAIAIGAMTPDLPLFVRGLPLHYGRTHDLSWLPATVLLALVLMLIWRCALRPVVRDLAPRWLGPLLPGEWDRGAVDAFRETVGLPVGGVRWSPARLIRGTLLLVVSLLLGVVSHIVWDLFTHEGRAGTKLLPFLDEQWGPLAGYKWLQHGSSAIGLLIIALWAILWLRRRVAAAPVPRVLPEWVRWAWLGSLPLLLMLAWGWGMVAYGPLTDEWTIAHLAYRVLPSACAVWGCLTLALCVTVQLLRVRSMTGVRV